MYVAVPRAATSANMMNGNTLARRSGSRLANVPASPARAALCFARERWLAARSTRARRAGFMRGVTRKVAMSLPPRARRMRAALAREPDVLIDEPLELVARHAE